MEPKLPSSNIGSERSPGVYGQRVEHAPVVPSPETQVEHERHHFEQRPATSQEAVRAPILPPPVVASPVSASAATMAQTTDTTDAPLVANDDDLIEKEWVDKAKQIITSTRDDPYRRELEVGKLQAEYLRKRYGKELGASQ